MAPAADTDDRLLALQAEVAGARSRHADLERRASLMECNRLFASAQTLRIKRDKAAQDLRRASERLASYVSRKQRGLTK